MSPLDALAQVKRLIISDEDLELGLTEDEDMDMSVNMDADDESEHYLEGDFKQQIAEKTYGNFFSDDSISESFKKMLISIG